MPHTTCARCARFGAERCTMHRAPNAPTVTLSAPIDWQPCQSGDALSRWAATTAVLVGAFPDEFDQHASNDTRADGATPDRAVLIGALVAESDADGAMADAMRTAYGDDDELGRLDGRGDSLTFTGDDAVDDIARWSLRQPADRVAVVPMSHVVASAARSIRDLQVARTLAVIATGDVQAASSGRIIATRLADALGIGGGETVRRRMATDALLAAQDALAAATLARLPMYDGQAVAYASHPTLSLIAGEYVVTGQHVHAVIPTREAEVQGISDTMPRDWHRAQRRAAQSRPIGAHRAPGRVSPVATDEYGYPARLGYSQITCTLDPFRIRERVATYLPDDDDERRAIIASEPTTLTLANGQRVWHLTTRRPDLTAAAWQDMTRGAITPVGKRIYHPRRRAAVESVPTRGTVGTLVAIRSMRPTD